jgi:hypothetical protein
MNLLKKREGGSDVGATTAEETGRRIRLRGASIRFTTCPAPALITSMEASLRERRKHRDESKSKRPIICLEKLKKKKTTTTRIQTPLPRVASHHGRRQRGGERLAGRSGEEVKGRTTQRQVSTGVKDDHTGPCRFGGIKTSTPFVL